MTQGLYIPPRSALAAKLANDTRVTQFQSRNRILIAAALLIISTGIGWLATAYGPFAGIGAIVVLVMAVIAYLNPAMTTVFIAFAFYANLPVVATRLGVPATIAGATFLALGLPMIHALLVKRERLIINQGLVLMVAYLAVQLMSAIGSADFTRSTDRIVSYVLEGMVLYFLIINTIRSPQTLKNVIWALIAAGILMGTLSIIQMVTGNFENDFYGLAQTKDTELSVGEANFFDEKPATRRLAGPIGSKNRYGQIMVVLLPLALLRFWADSNRSLRFIALMSAIPITAGALLTYSRGISLTLMALFGMILLLRLIPLWKTIVFGAIAALIITLTIPGFLFRVGTIFEVAALFTGDADEADGAIRGRATVNLVGIEIMKSYPLLGVGPGQSPLYARDIGNDIGYRWLTSDRRLHNMYLEEGADTGLIGLTLFLGIVAVKVYALNKLRIKWRNKNPEYYYTILGILLAIFCYLITAVFLHLSYIRYYWFLLALAGAAIHIYSNQPDRIQKREPAGS